MSAQAPNPVAPPVFEIPRPVDEFGQDGGKFYRCYDALAEEIDEDMVRGLKEQLDGMLIFAGLFAGVNTAFLALTLPLLSADTADDISALLAQNNAILIQVLTGRNDTDPTAAPLPSAGFSPSRDIFAINALFSLSLAFAIISSFLAVLGRQWLVYYRKRSGGGPEKQRWEQLKRFLGAERWRLEPILDDVLPSFLQIGLIIFCVSLILYLRHLSPAISVIVGIPMYIGLAFFIGSALCTVWDKCCPFQSPLSHVLVWSARTIPPVLRAIIEWLRRMVSSLTRRLLIWIYFSTRAHFLERWLRVVIFGLGEEIHGRADESSFRHWWRVWIHGRAEETSKSLQVIALQRAICTSDDPETLLHATANIFAITDVSQLKHLWSDPSFQDRFIEQVRHAYSRMLQLRGQNQVNIATASQRLYSAAAAHMILSSGSDWGVNWRFGKLIQVLGETSVLIPASQTPNPPTNWIQHGPPFTLRRLLYGYLLLDNTREDAIETLGTTLNMLVAPGATGPLDRNALLIGALRCVNQSMLKSTIDSDDFDLAHKFSLLQACERVLRSPQLSRAAQQVIQNIRIELSKYWLQRCSGRVLPSDVEALMRYIADIRTIHPTESGHHERIDILWAFGPSARQVLSSDPDNWLWEAAVNRFRIVKSFNEFVQEVDQGSRLMEVRPPLHF
ncbi:hypothetical protein FRC00_012189 [Tulasnella sp. 408]|nr:hypothetical protein FRC00_012189 [Tulasnella sp. 408]